MIAGRYELEREIGRGGTGAVWLAQDQVLMRPVAIKRIGLLPGSDETDRQRAEREARVIARLNHPNVVQVYDVAADADTDARWLVMEYVDGRTLAEVVRQRGPMPPEEAATLLWQAADALVAAHASGIVHRDVKPSNLMVDRDGQVKLTDFGIARTLADPSLTQTGMVTGSPAYLPPEVARGERGDEAVDVWSFGATTYFALAGKPPYDVGDNVLGALYKIVHDDPPALPQAGRLATLLANTMVKDPSRRWSMEQVRDYLAGTAAPAGSLPVGAFGATPVAGPVDDAEGAVAGGTQQIAPVPAASPSSAGRESTPQPTRHRRRSPVLLVAAAVVAVLVAIGVVWALVSGGGEDPGSQAASPSGSSSSSASEGPTAEGMEEFIRDYVATVSDDPAAAWKMLTPKFQGDSGGFERYRNFWEPAENGRVLSIETNPEDLSVSYQVHFDNFDNGPGPTVLDLVYEDGEYKIDGERTEGFVPAD